eukprot:GHVQ01018603.1.p1 GENE.GHVQ01018603.1~~GHVQ01018603.1.p1  ORF type:complete len:328 (+),score=27.25 GHVQ01018603.1:64-984(+)
MDCIGVACGGDRTVRVFDVSTAGKLGDANPQYVRTTLEGDCATAIDFSFDGKYVLCAKDFSRTMVRLRIGKDPETGRPLQPVCECSVAMHKNRVRWLVASKGNWFVTCSEDDDTDVKLWNYAGEPLASFNTKQVKNFQMAVSPMDGRFVCIAAWSPGVKIMEVVSKSTEFNKIEKAMDLKSLKGIKAVCLSPDNCLAFTADKGGLLTLWNINVRYQVNEDAKTLVTYQETDGRFSDYTYMAFSTDNTRVIGISCNNIKIMNARNPKEFDIIEAAHGMPIDTLAVAHSGKFFVTGAADNRPRIWKLT